MQQKKSKMWKNPNNINQFMNALELNGFNQVTLFRMKAFNVKWYIQKKNSEYA